ncbi:MAG: GNAT family N-acetyltransferase [[Pasteurella] mairii]|uniref:tRNA(Met) cytidine acetyltransferase TmcA n=1 Tax=[Pasteurella] mairii TaxID=757 RepID=A0A379B623_9PAST|nr:GNAT family N-acetyltransferase [[Pasteurella] mairii]SUB33932.1 protein YpfI [[Pasteurella] mairii]
MKSRVLTLKLDQNPPHFPENLKESAVVLSPENFSKAKNLLGQEFDWILYDGRAALNLDALAIAVGTLRAGGELVLWLDENQKIDLDSQRWSGVEQGIEAPNFRHYFYKLIDKYRRVGILAHQNSAKEYRWAGMLTLRATNEQSKIINQILQQQSDLYIITAKRGRGKSALAGLLAQEIRREGILAHQNGVENHRWAGIPTLRLTAPNKSAVKTLQDFAEEPLDFIAPDELFQKINANPYQFAEDWLFIDEAAMLPLPLLFQFISTFKHIVITTTIHSYEGTGRGFLLKFLVNLNRSFQHFELTQPLRWAEGDKLEQFIDELLLLEVEDRLVQPVFNPQSAVSFHRVLQAEIVERIQDFYGLLTLAHYRTSPLDLRRLFDAPKQQFYVAETQSALLGGVWLMEEGDFTDEDLIEQICRGQRRPKGNLVAQALAFYYHFPQACELRSLRISRIAVQPNWQNQGLGQGLIEKIAQETDVDFLSVSFGYTEELMNFWQKCGFVLVQIGEHQEASSGCYSAIALRGISVQGMEFVQQVRSQFERDFALSFHPLSSQFATEVEWELNEQDFCMLQNFANFHRTLMATIPSLRRLARHYELENTPLLQDFLRYSGQNPCIMGKKDWLKKVRLEIKVFLQQLSYSEI